MEEKQLKELAALNTETTDETADAAAAEERRRDSVWAKRAKRIAAAEADASCHIARHFEDNNTPASGSTARLVDETVGLMESSQPDDVRRVAARLLKHPTASCGLPT